MWRWRFDMEKYNLVPRVFCLQVSRRDQRPCERCCVSRAKTGIFSKRRERKEGQGTIIHKRCCFFSNKMVPWHFPTATFSHQTFSHSTFSHHDIFPLDNFLTRHYHTFPPPTLTSANFVPTASWLTRKEARKLGCIADNSIFLPTAVEFDVFWEIKSDWLI